jgi:catechol 2,3-dioxygenase-like lactoylglutathione lyase family enzyme
VGIANLVFYSTDPQRLAAFWAAALGYRVVSYDGEFGDKLRAGGLDDEALAHRIFVEDPDGGATLVFRHTSVPKEGRNRLHFDVRTTPGRIPTPEELEEAKARLISLGATVVRLLDTEWGPFHEHYYQLLDPEGNEFCLI